MKNNNNQLLAKFMGFYLTDFMVKGSLSRTDGKNKVWHCDDHTNVLFNKLNGLSEEHPLLFDKSWDWLIPVYKQIKDKYFAMTIDEVPNDELLLLKHLRDFHSQLDLVNLYNWICIYVEKYGDKK